MKTTSNHNNPFNSLSAQADNETGALLTLQGAVEHEVKDFVALELTAEHMAKDEASLLGAYVSNDAHRAHDFWHDLKDELFMWELSAGRLLLTAADPTRVEWQRAHWWGDDEAQFH